MIETSTAKTVVSHPYFAIICSLCVFFVLPQHGAVAIMVGSAGILSVYLAVLPERFRDRSGSLLTAICLIAAMWLLAAIVTAMVLIGEVQF